MIDKIPTVPPACQHTQLVLVPRPARFSPSAATAIVQFSSQMDSLKSHAQDIPMFVDEPVEATPEHSDPCTEDRDDMERESLSQRTVNVSQDMRLIVTSVKPQACPHCRPPSFLQT